ncbi:MAG: DNA cytosine methyltransferase [Clostridiales Family XIII bacterium]|jgi:DNA (cytosine-5)-methyltransferase 1|nr:DNA cytosine methyltransferase [Clostridiales Family XIII bacterium]
MRTISLFSGAGGLDLGFVMAGHDIVWANDCYGDAVETYKKNIGDHIVNEDICNVDSKDIPPADIVIEGFPCQGFSVANMKRHTADERNELYKQLIRVIADKQPTYFLAENVKGILSLGGGAVFQMILDDFRSLGYEIDYRLLNAADYGVPQKRERVFIAGVRKDVRCRFDFPIPTHSIDPDENARPWVSVADAFRDIPDPDSPNNLPNHEYSKYKINFNGYLGHRVIDAAGSSPTVTGRGDDRGGVVVLPHPNNSRRMTCRELAAIQSFPLDYEFQGPRSSAYRQIANAVPPLLAYHVAKQFSEANIYA